jgi:hypothetical protein
MIYLLEELRYGVLFYRKDEEAVSKGEDARLGKRTHFHFFPFLLR